jgi:peroxiredoxin
MKRTPLRLGASSTLAMFHLLSVTALGSAGAVAHAAPSKPPAKNGTKAPAAAKPAPAPKGEGPSEAAKQALMKVVESVKQQIATAPNKEKAAKDGLATLQKYARDHAREPIGDTAKLTAAHLQFQLGQTEEALAVFRQVAAAPVDRQAGWAAQMSLAQMLAQTGKYEEAEKLLNGIVAKNEDANLTEAAKAGLAAVAVRPGQKLAAFTAKDTTGKSHSLSSFEGKVLLVDFWATWCGPCREEMPNVKKVYAQYKDQGFAILGVSLDREQSALDAYVKEQGIEWPQVFEGGQDLAQMYAVTAIPRMLLLDRQGVIRAIDPRGPELEKAVAEVLGAEMPAEPK